MTMGLQSNLFSEIATNSNSHARTSAWYKVMSLYIGREIHQLHKPSHEGSFEFAEYGNIVFPFFSMGNVDSSALFGLDEMIMFSLYYSNRNRYRKVLDLGANIGLHTLLMKKLGFETVSYEPDLGHMAQLRKVLDLNALPLEGLRQKAISDKSGIMQYLRVLGNTTGSHLVGAKDGVYGPTEITDVEVDDILQTLNDDQFDLIKMDVEGYEVVLMSRIVNKLKESTDVILEIGSEKNALSIFELLEREEVPAYSQKTNWDLVRTLNDLPSHHTEGSLFVSKRGGPNWSST